MALTALVVSVASLFVARHQAQVMDRQLAASVWPLLEYYTSNIDGAGNVGLKRLTLHNAGVGPLRVRSFRLNYAGRPVTGPRELWRACCAGGDTTYVPPVTLSYTVGRILSAGDEVSFVTMRRSDVRPAAYDAFERAGERIRVRVCYCSVLDDCWVRGWDDPEPAPVRSCAAEQRAPQYR